MDLRVQMDEKFGQLKIESKSEMNRITINAFEVRFMVKYRGHLIIDLELHQGAHLCKDAQKVAIDFHLFLQLPIIRVYKIIQSKVKRRRRL